ncbi:MAG: hypothetical protein EZS28_043029, partial [Streblomastix strix]
LGPGGGAKTGQYLKIIDNNFNNNKAQYGGSIVFEGAQSQFLFNNTNFDRDASYFGRGNNLYFEYNGIELTQNLLIQENFQNSRSKTPRPKIGSETILLGEYDWLLQGIYINVYVDKNSRATEPDGTIGNEFKTINETLIVGDKSQGSLLNVIVTNNNYTETYLDVGSIQMIVNGGTREGTVISFSGVVPTTQAHVRVTNGSIEFKTTTIRLTHPDHSFVLVQGLGIVQFTSNTIIDEVESFQKSGRLGIINGGSIGITDNSTMNGLRLTHEYQELNKNKNINNNIKKNEVEDFDFCTWKTGMIDVSSQGYVSIQSSSISNIGSSIVTLKGKSTFTTSGSDFTSNGVFHLEAPWFEQNVHCEGAGIVNIINLQTQGKTEQNASSLWVDNDDCELQGLAAEVESELFVPEYYEVKAKKASQNRYEVQFTGLKWTSCKIGFDIYEQSGKKTRNHTRGQLDSINNAGEIGIANIDRDRVKSEFEWRAAITFGKHGRTEGLILFGDGLLRVTDYLVLFIIFF